MILNGTSIFGEDEFLPFARPWISEEAIQDIAQCLRSGWITTGPKVQKFEEALKTYCRSSHALVLSSATAGLFLALKALNLQPDDEIITTPMTFVCTANTIVQAGGQPIFADINDKNYNIDINQIRYKVTSKTRAIIPVHFHGLPIDLDPLYDLAKQYNIRVIEDAAHAIGAEYKGKRIGSFGDTQVFSFHPNKNMTTGEGGCVTTSDENLLQSITLNRFHGIDRAAWNRYGKSGSQEYDVSVPGYKFNMMDIQAALGLHQLSSLEDFINQRKNLVNRYYEHLSGWKEFSLPVMPSYNHRHAWHQFAICLNSEHTSLTREMFMQKMLEQNIGTGLQYNPVHLYDFYRRTYGFKEGDYPMAEKIGKSIVSLPLFPLMNFQDQDRVIKAIKIIFKRT